MQVPNIIITPSIQALLVAETGNPNIDRTEGTSDAFKNKLKPK
jgi:hypothetical protein